jgi:hypothetical protein
MGIPSHLLVHAVTLTHPTTSSDAYNDEVEAYAGGSSITAWLQQNTRAEPHTDGRDPLVQTWLLMTNEEDVRGRDRVTFDGVVYEVDGPPEKVYTPAGFHHTEATLRLVTG